MYSSYESSPGTGGLTTTSMAAWPGTGGHRRDEFDELSFDVFVHVHDLHVARSEAALAHVSFRGGMERGQLDRRSIRLAHFEKDFSERMERRSFGVNIILIDFISKNKKTSRVGELEHIFNIFVRSNLTSRIAGVDDTDCLWLDIRIGVCSFELLKVKRPVGLLVQVVRNNSGVKLGQTGGVERILWNWNHDSILRSIDKHFQQRCN